MCAQKLSSMDRDVEAELQKLRDEAAVHIQEDSPAVVQVGLCKQQQGKHPWAFWLLWSCNALCMLSLDLEGVVLVAAGP